MRKSVAVRTERCPLCAAEGKDTSGDNATVYSDGHAYCHAGHGLVFLRGSNDSGFRDKNKVEEDLSIEQLPFSPLKARGIRADVAELYGTRVEFDPVTGQEKAYHHPVFKNGRLTGWHTRILPKNFVHSGDCKDASVYGANLCQNGGKFILVTEGEEDCLALKQMYLDKGKDYRVVAVRGTSGFRKNLEFFEKFDNVAICFDQDEPGIAAANEFAECLTPGKARVVRWDGGKDPNEMLLNGKSREILQAVSQAQAVRPDGIVSGKDTYDRLKKLKRAVSIPWPPAWKKMNETTYGIRTGELETFTSGTGSGKTQTLRELQYHLFNSTDDNIGVIALEEPIEDSVEALMSLHLNKRIHLPPVRETITEEEYDRAWVETVGTNRFHFYDHFGSVAEDSLINKIRFMARGLGCKYIFLDHLTIAISEFADEGDERQRIDVLMSRLKKLTQELDVWIGLVVHLRKTGSGVPFEEGAVPSLDDLRGSGSIKQLSNSVFALSRNQQAETETERNTSQLHVLKHRFTGTTGPSDKLFYNKNTGRMTAVEQSEDF